MPPSTVPGPSTAPAGDSQNPRKRTGSELLGDGREAKKVKVGSERATLSSKLRAKSEKDKKYRKKKKKTRRLPVVAVDAERAASNSRSTTTQPASAPQALSPDVKSATEPEEQLIDSVDKGKRKATSPEPGLSRVASPSIQPNASTSTMDYASEIARLKEQVATQAQLIERHETHLNTSQQSLTCQICLDLLYKPYALAPCGHITCYSCLVRWFTTPANPTENHLQALPTEQLLSSTIARNGAYIRRKKNCPVCRAAVVERPAELWDIKSMVQALVRSKLVEIPATVEEPAPATTPTVGTSNTTANAKTDPWRNIFPVRPARAGGVLDRFGFDLFLPQHMGLHDAEDGGIYRCIDCHNEIVDGACSGCAREYAGHLDLHGGDTEHSSDEDDEWHGNARLRALLEEAEDEGDMDDDDDPDYPGFLPQGFWGGGAPIFHLPDGDDLTDEGDEDDAHYGHIFEVASDVATEVDEHDNDDEDSQYGGSFIDDDELVDIVGSDRRRGVDDSDEEVEFVDLLDGPSQRNHRRPMVLTSDNEGDTEADLTGEEDEGAPQAWPVYRHPRRRPIALDGTDEDDEEE